ncbi:MAG: sensor histidine kinase [Candidatus Hermodarchaeota archaeon]
MSLGALISNFSFKKYSDSFVKLSSDELRKKLIYLLIFILIIGFSAGTAIRLLLEFTSIPQPGYEPIPLLFLNMIIILGAAIILPINRYFSSKISGFLTLLMYLTSMVLMYLADGTFGIVTLSVMILIILISGLILPRNFILVSMTLIVAFIVIASWIAGNLLISTTPGVIIIILIITIIEWLKHTILQSLIRNLQRELRQRKQAQNEAAFFVDLMLHDLSNVNQIIMSGLELLSEDLLLAPNADPLQSTVGIISTQINRINRLIEAVRKFSQINDETLDERLVRTDIYDAFAQASEQVILASKKKIQVKTNIEKKRFWVQANELLVDIFYNILHNAVKFTEKDTTTVQVVASDKNGDFIEIQFIDEGSGISNKEGILKRMELGRVGGRGIGLTLVKRIIESYGGQLKVIDNVSGDSSKGTNFIVLLPS